MNDRILIAHIILRLDMGGMENGLVNLINGLPPGRFRHVIICLKDYSDFRARIDSDDVDVYALDKKDGKDPAIYLKVLRLLRRIGPDIVHTRNLGTIDMVFPATLAGVPIRIHGEHGWDMVDLHGDNRKYRMLRKLCKPLVSRYVTVSADLRNWLMSRVGIDGKKISHICNGVDAEKFRPGRDADRGSFVMPWPDEDSIVIGTVGRLVAVKDQRSLVRAFLALRDRHPSIRSRLRLIIVGDGPMREELQRLTTDAGAEDACCFAGRRDDIDELLRAMDLFVLPSLNEGISNTILEAMSSGLPVVATDVGGNSELVVPGRTGALVPPSSPDALVGAMEQYLESPDLLRSHGSEAREAVERKFSLRVMIDSYARLYEEQFMLRVSG